MKNGKCAICQAMVKGLISTGAKSKKTISRPYGGSLCTNCSRLINVEATRVKNKSKNIESVDFSYRKYVQTIVDSKNFMQ